MKKDEIIVNPPIILVLILLAGVSSLIFLSSKIYFEIRILIIVVLFIFSLLFLTIIKISNKEIIVFNLFGKRKRSITFGEVKQFVFKKGARASLPFSFRIISKNSEEKDITFNIEQKDGGDNIVSILKLMIDNGVKIERGNNALVDYYYNQAINNKADKGTASK